MTPSQLHRYVPVLPDAIYDLVRKVGPLNRLHNGHDTDRAINMIAEYCAANLRGEVKIHRYEPGQVYNYWIVPPRWTLKSFKLLDPTGRVIADNKTHPLVVAPHSVSTDQTLSLAELKQRNVCSKRAPEEHIFYFRNMYRHWERDWRISIPLQVIESLSEGMYRVIIESEISNEPCPIFDYFLPGRRSETIAFVAHLDHPTLVNDSLSGCLASLQVLTQLEGIRTEPEYSYRVLLVPEIIGSAVWAESNPTQMQSTVCAFCPNLTAHPAPIALGTSRRGDTFFDLALLHALRELGCDHVVGAFKEYPGAGDEIAFDVPGYDIPAPQVVRRHDDFAGYHNTLDCVDNFLKPDWQRRHQELVWVMCRAVELLEHDRELTRNFKGLQCLSNPELDLYLSPVSSSNLLLGETSVRDLGAKAVDLYYFMTAFFNQLSAPTSILEIARRTNMPFDFVADYAHKVAEKRLISLSPVSRRVASFQTNALTNRTDVVPPEV